MAKTGGMSVNGDREHGAADASGDGSDALLPPHVRRWVLAALSGLILMAIYLFAVRGAAILFELRDAVGAFCF